MAVQVRAISDYLSEVVEDGADTIAIDTGTRENPDSPTVYRASGTEITVRKVKGGDRPDLQRLHAETMQAIQSALEDAPAVTAIRLRSSGYNQDRLRAPLGSWQAPREIILGENAPKASKASSSEVPEMVVFVRALVAAGMKPEDAGALYFQQIQAKMDDFSKPDRNMMRILQDQLKAERAENSELRKQWKEGYVLAIESEKGRANQAEARAFQAEERARLNNKEKSETAQIVESIGNALAKAGPAGQGILSGVGAGVVASINGEGVGKAFAEAQKETIKEVTKEV